jgi:hypothetical protein
MRKLVVALLLLVLLVVGGDRLAARLAAGQAESQLVSRGFTDPHVVVHGFPFLTQAVAKRFDHITVTATSLSRSGLVAQDVHADLRDVRVDTQSSGTAAVATGTGIVTWKEIATAADLPLKLGPGPNGEVRVTGRVEILGQSLDIVAEAILSATGKEIRLRPTHLALRSGGVLDASLSRQLQSLLDLAYPVQGLPAGVSLTALTPEQAGIRVAVSAKNVAVH